MKTIERAAQAICMEDAQHDAECFNELWHGAKDRYRKLAIVAFEASKSASIVQTDAALECGGWSMNMIPKIERVWAAMIDAAVAEYRKDGGR